VVVRKYSKTSKTQSTKRREIFMIAFLGTGAYFAFSFFCLKKGDEWGAGAFILWALVSLAIASYYGTL